MIDFARLTAIASTEFADIAVSCDRMDSKLRVILCDQSYIDFYWSLSIPGRFSHHWERREQTGEIFRHDNSPHSKWQKVKTFPMHFHNGSDRKVTESHISLKPEQALREFLMFARRKLADET